MDTWVLKGMHPTAGGRLKLALRVVLVAASTAVSRAFSLPPSRLNPSSRRLSIAAVNPTIRSTTTADRIKSRYTQLPWRRETCLPASIASSQSHSAVEGLWPQGLRAGANRGRMKTVQVGRTLATAGAADEGVAVEQDDDGDSGLNESQREAVRAEIGPVRVVAGPGSGKTRVLTRRIAHLVRNVGAPAWSILAVTFTRKASEEMRTRVQETLGEERASKVALGTFHSICARMLRWHGDALPALVPGLDRSFSVFDSDDSRRLLAEILKKEGIDTTEIKPAAILSQISKLKSEGIGPDNAETMATGPPGSKKVRHQRRLADLYSQYQQGLVQSNALDFDDIILVALKMLKENQDVFRAIGRQYRHVLVDEWQDTNGPQYDLVLELARAGSEAQHAREAAWRAPPPPAAAPATTLEQRAATGVAVVELPPRSIFVVGDTDQCIYRFRGADYTNVARFEKDFEGCLTVVLRENYRSSANIARAASAVIEKVDQRVKLPTLAVQGAGLPIGVMQCSDAAGEASAIASQAEAYWTSGRVSASEMAVMYRTNAQSRSFEEAFLRRALPFVVVGAQRFYERREIKDCLVYLRLAANPCDALAMRRAINTPPRGIGAKTVEALQLLHASARAISGLESITGPECLIALLDDDDLSELEASLAGSPAGTSSSSAAEITFTNEGEGALGGGAGVWTEGEEVAEAARVAAAATAAVGGEETAEGWRGFSVQRVRWLREAIESGDVEGPTRQQGNKLRVFARVVCRLRVVAATAELPELLRTVLSETDMQKYVTESLSTTGKAEGADRWQNVMELERAASNPKFSGIAGEGALEAFLTEVALMGGDDVEGERKLREEAEAAGEAEAAAAGRSGASVSSRPEMIQLMTVHASKGLEFDTVFLTGLEEGTFPSERSYDNEELDEERRLMYVGMTRAKSRLFLSWREERMLFGGGGGSGARREESEPSNFLDDIPVDIVKYIDKTTPGAKTRGASTARGTGFSSRGGGRRKATAVASGAQRYQSRSATTGQRVYDGDKAKAGRRDGGGGGREEHPLDFTTEMFQDVRPLGTGTGVRPASVSTRRKSVSVLQGRTRGTHGYSGGYGGATGGSHGYSGRENLEGRPIGEGLSEGERRMQAFREARSREAKHRYPTSPVVRDGGVRQGRDAGGAGIDTSWAAKLADTPTTSVFGVCVGAKVNHPVHGRGEVVALVEGTNMVNVRFLFQGEPFVTRVVGEKLKVL